MSKKLFIKTFGCQMNVYDSGRMADVLAPIGYERIDQADDADMVILNTCHIREKAAEKVYSDLGRLRRLKEGRSARGGDMIIAVAGCVAQAEGAEVQRRAPFVDIVLGPQTYHRLPEMIARAHRSKGGVLDTEFPMEPKFDALPGEVAPRGLTTFLTVQEGCDKFCTFCVVPYTRGAEFSRSIEDIETEARRLVAAGTREITLLGQNVNAFHGAAPGGREWGLGRLIRHLAEIDGLDRIRYTTSHPRDMDEDLVTAHRDVPQLMPYLHLPVQSGSDRILTAMNRGHSAANYLALIDRLRAARPDIALSSDFIVGFPGERAEDFEATLHLVETVGYAQAFSFKYSARPGTPAASLAQVDTASKDERLARLQDLLRSQQAAFNRACIGRTLQVLFEKTGRHPGQLVGRSPYLQAVHVPAAEHLIGDLSPVRIVDVGPIAMAGLLDDVACQETGRPLASLESAAR